MKLKRRRKIKILLAKKEKYRKSNELLDSVIRYCYAEGEMLFVFDNAINKMRDKMLLSDSNNIAFEMGVLTDILNKKNIDHCIVEEHLIINISEKKYSKNEYEISYFTNKLNRCKGHIYENLGYIIFSIIAAVVIELLIIKITSIMTIDIIDLLRKIMFYIIIILGVFSFSNLIFLIKEKNVVEKKLRLSRIVLEDDSVDLI